MSTSGPLSLPHPPGARVFFDGLLETQGVVIAVFTPTIRVVRLDDGREVGTVTRCLRVVGIC